MALHSKGLRSGSERFEEIRTPDTPVIVERIVKDIDEIVRIVRIVRFPGWQQTFAGERQAQFSPHAWG